MEHTSFPMKEVESKMRIEFLYKSLKLKAKSTYTMVYLMDTVDI